MKNVGGIDIQNLNGVLISLSPYLIVTNGSAYFGNVLIDSFVNNSSNPFRIQALPDAPQGYDAFLKVFLSDNSSSIDTITIKIIIGKKDYLVWDPDRNNSSGPVIHSILQYLGYNGDYKNYHFYSFEHLLNYKSIFVCTGVAWDNFVLFNTSYEVQQIVNFIEQGGNVYLEGGECWYFDPFVMNGFNFNPYFGIRPVNDGYTDIGPIEGVYNTFTDRMLFRYNGENFYLDQIDSTETGFRIFHDQDNDYYCGVANIATNYKTVGVSFELAGLLDNEQSTKAMLLDSIMHFFGINLVGIRDTINSQFAIQNPQFLSTHPNPFRNALKIKFQIPNSNVQTSLKIFDATGRVVKSFNHLIIQPFNQVVWFGDDNADRKLPAGVYFIRLEASDYKQIEKAVLLR